MYARGNYETTHRLGYETIHVTDAEGLALAHDITEIRKDEFKGRAFKKGHVVRSDDIRHLLRRAALLFHRTAHLDGDLRQGGQGQAIAVDGLVKGFVKGVFVDHGDVNILEVYQRFGYLSGVVSVYRHRPI